MGNSGGGALALVTRMVADFFMTILWATIVSTTGYLLSLLSPVHQDDDTIEVVLILLIVICQVHPLSQLTIHGPQFTSDTGPCNLLFAGTLQPNVPCALVCAATFSPLSVPH